VKPTKRALKLLCFSDLHLTNKSPKFKIRDHVSDLLTHQCQFVDWIIQEYDRGGYDYLLFLGDWTDYPTLDPVVQTKSNELLGRLVKETRCVMIEGNHCISDAKGAFTVLGAAEAFLKGLDHSNAIVSQQKMVEFPNVRFWCYPYVSDYLALAEQIASDNANLDEQFVNVMLFHFPTTNAVLDNSLQSKKGVALTQDIISNFDIVIGGDFHRPQKLLLAERAYYVGAPFDFNYGDHVEKRGAMSVKLASNKEPVVEWIDNPFRVKIRKVTVDEVLSMGEKEIEEGIFRVVGETPDLKTMQQLSKLAKNSYKMDLSVKPADEFELSDSIRVIESIDPSRDAAMLENTLSGHARVKDIMKKFKEVKLMCQ
jgi:DNA repair exonuclease SbcCD nuclease subunit